MKISAIFLTTISLALADLGPPSQYLPPQNQYLPPQNQYLPPQNQYLPPQRQYLPPQNQYLPPTVAAPAPKYLPPSTSYGVPSVRPTKQYLPPSTSYGASYDPSRGYEERSEPANYEFEYQVKDEQSGNDFGHKEQRKGDVAQGKYYVLLPDGRLQTVEYTADTEGYKPKISYQQVSVGGYQYPSGGGYQYRK
ncbi:pro-resilin-like [Anthonomus grandis grandis]|uniref:pro-resilin-like n=1 Tax=Anthonomus grandis grandis TaxID=2921223 RepID=UPI002166AC54|nr:pro-resilin-like [Anthonomus grandis grandis]